MKQIVINAFKGFCRKHNIISVVEKIAPDVAKLMVGKLYPTELSAKIVYVLKNNKPFHEIWEAGYELAKTSKDYKEYMDRYFEVVQSPEFNQALMDIFSSLVMAAGDIEKIFKNAILSEELTDPDELARKDKLENELWRREIIKANP